MPPPNHLSPNALLVTLFVQSMTLTYAMDIRPISADPVLECHVREYKYTVTKQPAWTPDGRVLQCSGEVVVDSCWGLCDSSEIPDFKVPYKLSNHRVCTYNTISRRVVRLADCDAQYPDPEHEVIDALSCNCSYCAGHDTSCQTLNS